MMPCDHAIRLPGGVLADRPNSIYACAHSCIAKCMVHVEHIHPPLDLAMSQACIGICGDDSFQA
jgi:hypothetical protein